MMRKGLLLMVLLCLALPAYAWQLQTRVATVGGNMAGNGVTQTSANGTVYKNYTNDVQPAIVVTADPGYKISNVYVNGTLQAPVPTSPANYTMGMVVYPSKPTQSVIAYFAKETYALTTVAGTGGTVSPAATNVQTQFGTVKTVVFSPLAGKNVVNITGQPAGTVLKNYATGAVVTLPAPVDVKVSATFTMPAEPVTLTGVFIYITATTDGPRTVLFPGNDVSLTASASNPAATFVWSQIEGPGYAPNAVPPQPGITGTGATLTFTPVAVGTYRFRVVATIPGASATAYTYAVATDNAVAAATAQCNVCHGAKNVGQAELAGWSASQHAAASPPTMCYLCHLNYTSVGGGHGGPLPTNVVCANCHSGPHAAGYPACFSCHDPHLLSVTVAADSCVQCHPAEDVAWGTSPHATNPTQIVSCAVCHTGSAGAHPDQMPTSSTCQDCHGLQHGAQFTDCAGCHNAHSTEPAGGGGCSMCHGYPPASGAHVAHFGLTETSGTYTDLKTLEERNPTATIDTAPTVYAYGCAICHSVDSANHMNGEVDVILYEASADPDSLKARNSTAAAYDPFTGICSGVYCHSTGQANPVYQTAPAWTSTEALGCDACHGNPPAYPSGGAGVATANNHIGLADDGYTYGHFSGIRGPWHNAQHGNPYGGNDDSAPITCQTCHYETTDPANVGPNGFYWLDTTGNYQYPGMIDPAYEAGFLCGTCHNSDDPANPAVGTGRVLPLRHVNGKRDVIFDPRESLPADIAWLPADPNKPTRPMWFTGASKTSGWPTTGAPITWNGTTRSWSLSAAAYDPVTKTCANTSCHVQFETTTAAPTNPNPVWGSPFRANDWSSCCECHKYCY